MPYVAASSVAAFAPAVPLRGAGSSSVVLCGARGRNRVVSAGRRRRALVCLESDGAGDGGSKDGEVKDGAGVGAQEKGGELGKVKQRVIVLGESVRNVLGRVFAPWSFVWGIGAGVVVSFVVFLVPLPVMLEGGGGRGGAGGIESVLREKVFLYDVILNDINAGYVDNVDVDKLFEASISGMLSTLDPFSQFENNAEAVEMNVKTTGKYGGVGLGIGNGEVLDAERKALLGGKNCVVVVTAFEGYAFDVGLRPGDVIGSVDGVETKGKTVAEVTELLRGEPGTSVQVEVLREGVDDGIKFVLPRRKVQLRDVPVATFVGDRRDAVGYIRLQSFAKDAADEVAVALSGLQAEAKRSSPTQGLKGLVLDLRGNPGGLLESAIKVTETLVPRGSVVVSTKGRGTGPGPIYLSNSDPIVSGDLPIAVLVNGQTASASEVVAGAVQDLDRGIIVGSRSYGKGLVQQLLSLPFQTALKYTSGRYFTPSGRCIQALTYADKDANGQYEAKAVPETERKQFLTRHGRVVRDGGGIEPDVETKHRVSFLENALMRQNMFFHFASRYAAERKLETLPGDFAVDDTVYREFIRFVSATNFKYESRFDEAFGQLDEMFSDVGYDVARGKVEDLRRATVSEMRSDFSRHERDIKAQVESAIRFRLQPDSKRLIAELQHDDQLREAVRLLRSPSEYASLLAPKAMIAQSNGGTVAAAPHDSEAQVSGAQSLESSKLLPKSPPQQAPRASMRRSSS